MHFLCGLVLLIYQRVFLLPLETAVTLKGFLENQNLEHSSFPTDCLLNLAIPNHLRLLLR